MTPMLRKPKPDFIVRLVAPGLRPWLVPTRALARVLEAVQRLIEQREDFEDDEEVAITPQTETPEGRVIKLVSVKAGSAEYAFSAPNRDVAWQQLRLTGESIEQPDTADWTSPTISSVKQLSEIARSIGCEIEFRLPGETHTLGDVIAIIKPHTYAAIADHAFIYGHTSVFAKVERVGGATDMHCGLRLPNQSKKMVICRVVGEELVRNLGKHIYQNVVVSGNATWIRHNRRLKRLEITSFEPPKTSSIRDAFREAYEAGAGAWDAIADPTKFVSEMRGR